MCANCIDKVPLTRMGYVDPVVVCKSCIPTCKAEEEFFKNHLKTLTTGKATSQENRLLAVHAGFCPGGGGGGGGVM